MAQSSLNAATVTHPCRHRLGNNIMSRASHPSHAPALSSPCLIPLMLLILGLVMPPSLLSILLMPPPSHPPHASSLPSSLPRLLPLIPPMAQPSHAPHRSHASSLPSLLIPPMHPPCHPSSVPSSASCLPSPLIPPHPSHRIFYYCTSLDKVLKKRLTKGIPHGWRWRVNSGSK